MAKPEDDAVADRRANVNISLLDSQVSTCSGKVGCGSVKAHRIRAKPQSSCVACGPIILAQRLRKCERNYVQVETIVLAGRSVKSTASDIRVTGARFPYHRRAHISA